MHKHRSFLALAAVLALSFQPAALKAQTAPRFQQASNALVDEGRQAAKAGRTLDARLAFERAMIANPQNIDAYLALADLQQATDNIAEAYKYFSIALDIDPSSRPAIAGQATIEVMRGELDSAQEALARLDRLCGTDGCAEQRALKAAIDAAGASNDDG
jgi:tetratricopeptide (TPR) repeat protein